MQNKVKPLCVWTESYWHWSSCLEIEPFKSYKEATTAGWVDQIWRKGICSSNPQPLLGRWKQLARAVASVPPLEAHLSDSHVSLNSQWSKESNWFCTKMDSKNCGTDSTWSCKWMKCSVSQSCNYMLSIVSNTYSNWYLLWCRSQTWCRGKPQQPEGRRSREVWRQASCTGRSWGGGVRVWEHR